MIQILLIKKLLIKIKIKLNQFKIIKITPRLKKDKKIIFKNQIKLIKLKMLLKSLSKFSKK